MGRVKVSRSKVPSTFIDEALVAFKQKEKSRRRNLSGDDKERQSSPTAAASYQAEGSGYSVPNLSFKCSIDKAESKVRFV